MQQPAFPTFTLLVFLPFLPTNQKLTHNKDVAVRGVNEADRKDV